MELSKEDLRKALREAAASQSWERSERLRLKAEIEELKARPREEVKARVLSYWKEGPPSFEHGAYLALDVRQIMDIRERNNVKRPSFYGAEIQELTSTALFLYSLISEMRKEPPARAPLPQVFDVQETHGAANADVFVLVALDHSSGKKNRFSVICVNRRTFTADCVGRELPIKHARKIATDTLVERATPA